jgi:hypothetical protein
MTPGWLVNDVITEDSLRDFSIGWTFPRVDFPGNDTSQGNRVIYQAVTSVCKETSRPSHKV